MKGSKFQVTKNYSPENGFSATFRQWRATSHCRFIHGYALGVELTLECGESELDGNGWVANFGGLKKFKQYLCDTFDHKTLAATDDPLHHHYVDLEANGLIQLVEVERTGCEGFARMVGEWFLDNVLPELSEGRNVQLHSVKVYEHTGNAAIWFPKGHI